MPSSSFFSGTNPTPTEYENAVDLVAQATTQATAALASQTAAATSAQSAQGYSVSAGTSADTATAQAAAASTSATSASNSASAAATSATAAGSSASAASSSASSASTSATNASNSATSAAGSATSASTYATNAANSATAAANSASDAAATLASALVKTNNLSDLSNASTARSNLGLAIGSNVQAWDADLEAIAAISSTSGLLKKTAANTWSLDTTSYLSGTVGLANGGTGATDAAGARTALGLGTAATAAATSFAQVANNLSDLVSASTARTNLGLGTAATLASSAVLQSANNLSDLGNVTTARTNLGLSALATTTPGTGVATALGVNTGTAGAFVVNGGALGTPASGNLANCTFPTLNQNTTGTAAGLSSTLAVGSGGTGLTSLTAGYIPYGNGTGAFGVSPVYTNGTAVGVNTTSFYSGNLFQVSNSTNGALRICADNQNTGGSALAGLSLQASGGGWTIDVPPSATYTNSLLFKFGSTQNMELTSAGNLGLGVTPSAWGGNFKSLEMGNAGYGIATAISSGYIYITQNTFNNGTNWVYKANGTASRYYAKSDGFVWDLAASGSAGAAISFTQAMTLDASGRLGVGVTSPSYRVQASSNIAATSTGVDGTFADVFNALYSGDTAFYGSIQHSMSSVATNSGFRFMGGGNNNVTGSGGLQKLLDLTRGQTIFYTGDTERARIDSSGNLLVGTTSSVAAARVTATCASNGSRAFAAVNTNSGDSSTGPIYVAKFDNVTTSSNVFIQFAINNQATGSGQINANGTNAAAFGSYSDARLKENITPLTSQLSNILALKPSEFDYLSGGHQIGFIAQEMQEVYPDVVGEGDDEMLVITGWSKTEARLVSAIQELAAKVSALEARVA